MFSELGLFIFNNLTEDSFTFHTIQPSSVYNSVTSICKFTKWCGHHHDPALGLFRRPKGSPPGPLRSLLAQTPSPRQPLRCFATVQICLFRMILVNGIIQRVGFLFVFLHLVTFPLHDVSEMRAGCCVYQYLFCSCWIVFRLWMDLSSHAFTS